MEITSNCINLGQIALSKVTYLMSVKQVSVYALNVLIDYQTVIIRLMKKAKSYKFSEITAIFLNSSVFSETCLNCMKLMQYCSMNREDYIYDDSKRAEKKTKVEHTQKIASILNKNFKILENLLKMPKVGFITHKMEQQPYFFVMKHFDDILTLLYTLLEKNREFFATRINPRHELKKLSFSILRIINNITEHSYNYLEAIS